MITQQTNKFHKMHGTGNDFIIINRINHKNNENLKQLAKRLCNRHFGIGADGLLIVLKQQNKLKMKIINCDGSQAHMCGNGLRCFVAYLYNQKLIESNKSSILTDDGQKQVQIQQKDTNKYVIILKIGNGGQIQQINQHQKYFSFTNTLYFTTIGVPHIVIFLPQEQFNLVDFEKQGKSIQKNINANINFCKLINSNTIYVKTFQRGAGLTYSCGTGISSSVYVAITKGKIKQSTVNVITDGGQLTISLSSQNQVIMKGPGQFICEGYYI